MADEIDVLIRIRHGEPSNTYEYVDTLPRAVLDEVVCSYWQLSPLDLEECKRRTRLLLSDLVSSRQRTAAKEKLHKALRRYYQW